MSDIFLSQALHLYSMEHQFAWCRFSCSSTHTSEDKTVLTCFTMLLQRCSTENCRVNNIHQLHFYWCQQCTDRRRSTTNMHRHSAHSVFGPQYFPLSPLEAFHSEKGQGGREKCLYSAKTKKLISFEGWKTI